MIRATFYRILLSTVTSFTLFTLSLPTLLSIPIVQSGIFFVTAEISGYEIECESADFGWLSGLDIKKCKIKQNGKYDSLSIGSVVAKKPLYSYLLSPRELGQLEIDELEIVLSEDIEGVGLANSLTRYHPIGSLPLIQSLETTSAQKELPSKESQIEYELPDIGLILHLKKSRIFISKIGGFFASVEDLSAYAKMAQSPSSLQLHIVGNVASSTSDSQAPFQINMALSGKELFNDLEGNISAHLREIPSLILEGISSILYPKFATCIYPLIGQKCSFNIEGDVNADRVNLISSITSDNLKSAFNCIVSAEEIRINKAKILDFTFSKELFDHSIHNFLNLSKTGLSLQKPVKISLSMEEPATYSIQTESFSSPFLLKFAHTPAFIIERAKDNPIFLNCHLDCQGDSTGERLRLKIMSGYHRMSEEIEASISITTNKPQSQFQIAHGVYRLFNTDFSLSGNCLQILSEELQLPLQQAFGPSLTTSCHVTGFMSDTKELSYKGTYNALLENGAQQGIFHGDANSITLEKSTGRLFIPYQNCIEAVHQKREDYLFDEMAGITIQSNLPNCTIPFKMDTDSAFNSSSIQYAIDISSDPIESFNLSFATNADIQSYIRIHKSEGSSQISITGHAEAPFSKIPKPFLYEGSRVSPMQANYVASVGFEKGAIECALKEFTCRFHNALQFQIHNLTGNYFLYDKENRNILAEISMPSPLHISTKTAPPDEGRCFKNEALFLTNTYVYTKIPIQISRTKNIVTGLISSKIDCDIEAEKRISFVLPCTFDIGKRIIDGSIILKEMDEATEQREARAIIEYMLELPYKVMRSTMIEEATYRCNISSKKIDFNEFSPFLQPKIIQKISDFIGPSLQKCDIKAFFRGASSNENEIEGSIIADRMALKAHIESRDGNLIASPTKPFLFMETKLKTGAIKTLFPEAKCDLLLNQDGMITLSVQKASIPIRKLSFIKSLEKMHLLLQESCFDLFLKNSPITLGSTDSRVETLYEIPETTIEGSFNGRDGFFMNTIQSTGASNNRIHGKMSIKTDFAIPCIDIDQLIQKTSGDIDIHLSEVDIALIAKFSNIYENLATELLGPKAAVDVKGSITEGLNGSGSIQIGLKQGNITIYGDIKNGLFFPTDDIKAQIQIQKESGKLLFKNLSSILTIAFDSKEPIIIDILRKDVIIPLLPQRFKSLFIPKGVIAFGELTAETNGALKTILALFQHEKSRVNFISTPILFSIKNGKVQCKRSDFLIDKELHGAFWGDIDYLKNRIRMTLFIPNSSLKKLGLRSPFKNGLIIPISGKSSSPEIDIKRIGAQVTAMRIQKTGKKADIVRKLIESALSHAEDDTLIPKPSISPLPWEK